MKRPETTLAILPFENLTGSEADARLATGFVQDLIAELAGFPTLGVIAAQSVFAGGPQPAQAEHVLRGSIRRTESGLRISVQLVEAKEGRHLWAGRFDGGNLAEAHDEIAAKVANALAVQVDRAVLERSRRRQASNLAAYECWLRGMECLQRGTCEADAEGRRFFERAIESDPHYARAWGGLSLSHFNEWSCQAWDQWETREKLAYENAIRAESLDPNDAVVHLILGRIEQYRREFERARARFERARSLAPNDATILIQLSSCYTFDGDAALGEKLARKALELNPLGPDWYHCYRAVPLFVLGDDRASLDAALRAPPGLVVDAPAYRAAACAYLGDADRAARFLAEFREDFRRRISDRADDDECAQWLRHVNPYRNEADVRRLLDGLRRAGLRSSTRSRVAASARQWPVANIFRREGEVWTLSFCHEVAQLPPLRGLADLARLLASPGVEIASSELAGVTVTTKGVEALDERARTAYRNRLAEIEAELAAAGDSPRALALETERDGLIRELRRATGLGGRTRRVGESAERARMAVTWRIRHAIRRIAAVHPALGRHLEHSIRTGTSCSYRPEQETEWYT